MANSSAQNKPYQSAFGQSISLCGRIFIADSSGALFWPALSTLIVADMALGNPPGDGIRSGDTTVFSDAKQKLVQLAEVIDRYDAASVIVLDASVQRDNARASLDQETLEILHIMQEGRDWLWINGFDHGATMSASQSKPTAQSDWGGAMLPHSVIAGMSFFYQPRIGRHTHEIAGALKPAARISTWGHIVRRPCFLGNNGRLLLPAFGTSSGGSNVLGAAFNPLFGNDGLKIWMLSGERPNPVASRKLCQD